MSTITWKKVVWHGNLVIGSVGIIDDKVAAIVSFYEDADGDLSGNVTFGERAALFLSPIGLGGSTVAMVAMQAAADPDIIEIDPTFVTVANKIFMNFARQAMIDGVYAVYFSGASKMIAAGAASVVTGNAIKGFLVRKGFEAALKHAFKEAIK